MRKNKKGRRGVVVRGARKAQGSQGEGERERENKGTRKRDQRKRRGSEREQEEGEEKAPYLCDNQLVNQKSSCPQLIGVPCM